MVTKLNRLVTNNEEFPPKKSHDSLTTRSFEVTWQIKYVTSPLSLDQWLRNCKVILNYREGSHQQSHMTIDTSGQMSSGDKLKNYITTTTLLMVIKLGRVVTYCEVIWHLNSNNSFILWQVKIVISPLPQCMWLSKLPACWLTGASIHRVIRSFNHVV